MTKTIYLKQCKKDDPAVMYVPMMTAHIKSTTFTNICLQEIGSNLRNQLQKNEAAKNNKSHNYIAQIYWTIASTLPLAYMPI